MEKEGIISLLNDIFIPMGFKRKGNTWVRNGEILTKLVHLQKSQHSNLFYINYGFIINKLPLTTKEHVSYRLASNDVFKQKKITDLMDFETDISINQRISGLKELINEKIVVKMQSISNEEQLLKELQTRPHLNDIPLVVKKHFNIEE